MANHTNSETVYITGEVANLLGATSQQVRRLFEDGTLPEPARHGINRMIPAAMVAEIASELRKRGLMPTMIWSSTLSMDPAQLALRVSN